MKTTRVMKYTLWGLVSGKLLSERLYTSRKFARLGAMKQKAFYGREFKPVRVTVFAHVPGRAK